MTSTKFCFLLLLVGCFSFELALGDESAPKPLLRGTTFVHSPFTKLIESPKVLTVEEGRFQGFTVDLMNRIAQKVGFDYHLNYSEVYGQLVNGTMTGMVGEVYEKKVDFAVADLTITDLRKEYVDFTEPIMSTQLAVLLRKEYVPSNWHNLVDLVAHNNQTDKLNESFIKYSAIKSGATMQQLSVRDDPAAKQAYQWLQANPSYQTRSYREGFERVLKEGKIAFFLDSAVAEYTVSHECSLTMLIDEESVHNSYGIALPKNSTYLEPFNRAIRELKAEGELDKLKRKHWLNRCNSGL